MRGRQRWVLVLAAVLGIAGGVTTAILAPGASDPGGSAGDEINDPLRLGIPQVSLSSCTGEAVLVLGSGDSAAALAPTVSDAEDNARYLRSDESCRTLWSESDDVPPYVVYRGPYESEAEPCRTSLDGDGGRVTNLSAGNEMYVTCTCVLPTAELRGIVPPALLAENEEPAPEQWVRELQRLLDVAISGEYDDPTIAVVRRFQEDNGILPADGRVGERTWGALRERLCGGFEF
jgi:peptidoglycan hydrolase-like protein with peptidoglycan-binding domain